MCHRSVALVSYDVHCLEMTCGSNSKMIAVNFFFFVLCFSRSPINPLVLSDMKMIGPVFRF